MLNPSNVKLNKVERVIFNEILEEREPSHWTPHRRTLAAALAKTIFIVQAAQDGLQRQGYVCYNGRGNPVVNPLVRVLDQNMNTVCAYRRSLAIHARAIGGDARDIARRRDIRLEQQRNAPAFDNEGLISRPNAAPFHKEIDDAS